MSTELSNEQDSNNQRSKGAIDLECCDRAWRVRTAGGVVTAEQLLTIFYTIHTDHQSSNKLAVRTYIHASETVFYFLFLPLRVRLFTMMSLHLWFCSSRCWSSQLENIGCFKFKKYWNLNVFRKSEAMRYWSVIAVLAQSPFFLLSIIVCILGSSDIQTIVE